MDLSCVRTIVFRGYIINKKKEDKMKRKKAQ